MRRIREAVLPFTGNNDDRLPKTVREYRQKYKGVSQILDAHPEVLDQVHEDLKRLYLFITRYAKSTNARRRRKVRAAFRQLIGRVERIVEAARWFCDWAPLRRLIGLEAIVDELRRFLPAMRRVLEQARRAPIRGQKVPAAWCSCANRRRSSAPTTKPIFIARPTAS
jgi:hypothetical protein